MPANTPSHTYERPAMVAVYAAIAAFLTYTMIFGFRKSFTVCTFDGIRVFGMNYKTVLVISQMLGYMAAKFYGIKYISELRNIGRGKIILILVGISWASWLLFAIVPMPYNIIFLFVNGFPLGMLWGVIFSYVEGRRSTDFIGAALAVSFIFASGFVKTVGGWLLLELQLPELWVPFATGLVFALPLLVFVWMMEKIPPPDDFDKVARTERLPMSAAKRKELIKLFLPGIVTCILIYTFVTIFRDIRDNFSADMWKEMGYLNQPALFSKTETPITIVILVVIGSMTLIRKNFTAFMLNHLIIAAGFVLAGICTWLFANNGIQPFWWMTLTGLGLYMVYIPFNAVFFERMISSFRFSGNVGFLIYVSDSFGYLGSVAVLFSKEIFRVQLNWVQFFSNSVMVLSLAGIVLTAYSAFYFWRKQRRMKLNQVFI